MKVGLFISVVFGAALLLPVPIWAQWTDPVPLARVGAESAEEWSPFLSFDGRTLYFSAVRDPAFYDIRIFHAARDEPFGPFTTVTEALDASRGHVLAPWVSPDNLRMYYHADQGRVFTLRMSRRPSADAPWPEGAVMSEFRPLGVWLRMPKLTPDERTIFFDAFSARGGQGGYDIWTAGRGARDLPFGNIRNISEINTTAGEVSPFTTPDGLTLYFASDRYGRYQLFRATRETRDLPFGPPEHLAALDTPDGHSTAPSLSLDGTVLYFTRQFGSDESTRHICISYVGPGLWSDTIYVNKNAGDDLYDGRTPETPITSIQKAIDMARDGHTILVYPGTYTEAIEFQGKAITVRGTTGGAVLRYLNDAAVSFYQGEGPDSVLSNFVIRDSHTAIFIAGSSPTIRNVTVIDNRHGLRAYGGAQPDIRNCIFRGNTVDDVFGCQVHYSCLQRPSPGDGNISVDPLFVDAAGGNYRLLSERGRFVPAYETWAFDSATSPCIDAGDPASDYSAEPTPNGGRINMGSYGGTPQAGMSDWPIEYDFDHDGVADTADLLILIDMWMNSVDWAAPAN